MLAVRRHTPVDYSKCNQRITIYHRTVTGGVASFSSKTINAFFDFQKVQSVNKTGSTEVNNALIVIPKANTDGNQPIFVGDKVVLGEAIAVTTQTQWASLAPATTPNMVVVRSVDPKYWRGEIVHWEAGA